MTKWKIVSNFDFWFSNSKNKELSEKDWLIFKSEKQVIPNLFKFYIKKQQQKKKVANIVNSTIKAYQLCSWKTETEKLWNLLHSKETAK